MEPSDPTSNPASRPPRAPPESSATSHSTSGRTHSLPDLPTRDLPTRDLSASEAPRTVHTGTGGSPFAYSSPGVATAQPLAHHPGNPPALASAIAPPPHSPHPAPPPIRTSPSDVCSSCGYGLAGLAITDACPECQWPVVRSLRGQSLAAVPPERVATLRASLLIIVLAQFVEIASVFGHVAYGLVVGASAALNVTVPALGLAGTGLEVAVECVGILTSGATLLALWSLTQSDAAVPEGSPADRARRLLRGVACAALPLALLSSVAALFMLLGSPAAGAFASVIVDATDVLGYIFIAVVMSASGWFYATLAARLPGRDAARPGSVAPPRAGVPRSASRPRRQPWTLEREARVLTWMSWVLLFPGMLACFLGPIAAVIWYLLLTIRLRAALGTVGANVAAVDDSGVHAADVIASGEPARQPVRSGDHA